MLFMDDAIIDQRSLRVAVDDGSFSRGLQYAARGAVAQQRWEPSNRTLQGLVRGSGSAFYTTIAYFDEPDGGNLSRFDHGVCSCPVGLNCKHVVALVITANSSRKKATAAPAATPSATASAGSPVTPAESDASELLAWELTLDTLLESQSASAASQAGRPSLAIQLSLVSSARRPAVRQPAPGEPRAKLHARLVQPGRNGSWVAGSLSWSKLESLRYYGSYSASAVRVLSDLYALNRTGKGQYAYYSYGDEKTIDLGAFESSQLWALLDQAAAAGLPLVHSHRPGEVDKDGQAELCLDVTRPDPAGPLVITPRLRVDGNLTDDVVVTFIGTQGHGVAHMSRPEAESGAGIAGQRFKLARLARPVPAQLQRMALADARLDIPVAGLARFRDDFYPRLRRLAPVISSDGAFEPPEISGPSLVLHATYSPGHRLDLNWEWTYQLGDRQLNVPAGAELTSQSDGYRDADAELALLRGIDAPLSSFGLLTTSHRHHHLVSPVQLHDIDTMRFTTELLPLLTGEPDLTVELTGQPADYREASDSMRIGISADEVAGDTDWFDLGITVTVDGQKVPFSDLFVGLTRGQSHLLLPDGAYFSLDKPELAALARLIEEARALQDAPPGELRISKFQASLWDELAELGVVSHQAAAWHEQVTGLLSVAAIDQPPVPASLSARLRPYQVDGFAWLAFLWDHRLGGILADDMGLGKTLQSLALICHARQPGMAPFLIVAPTSVVPNWAAEASRFAPGLRVVPVTETGSRRRTPLGEMVAGADAVVTSYALLRLDFDAYASLSWSGLILDEAQFTKNHQSKIYQCARRLPAPFKLAITGTPMENNLMELWSLLSITAPGLFPSPTRFSEYYARPIEKGRNAELLGQLRRRIKPLVMRRTKEQVAADLPPKQEQVLEVDLHPRHRKAYQTHLQRERQKVLGLLDDMNGNRFTIFRSLTLLRQLSLHAGLVDESADDVPSSKIDTLAEHLEDVIGAGHRALVFSQFTGFLGIVRARLEAEGVAYSYLDGSTRDRAAAIDQFKSGATSVFLISLKAGGFGLNLTEADYCFLLDPWWNPATEAQAIDRTHRIGQTRNVMVYRLIARDTIEEKVMALKERKAELFASVLDAGNLFGSGLDADDIRGLLA